MTVYVRYVTLPDDLLQQLAAPDVSSLADEDFPRKFAEFDADGVEIVPAVIEPVLMMRAETIKGEAIVSDILANLPADAHEIADPGTRDFA